MKKLQISGNLGRDVEVKTTNNGSQFAALTVAVNSKVNGQKVTEWFEVTANPSKKLSGMLPFLKKGSSVFVSGDFYTNNYQGRDGQMHTGIHINADTIDFVGGGQGQQQNGQQGFQQPQNGFRGGYQNNVQQPQYGVQPQVTTGRPTVQQGAAPQVQPMGGQRPQPAQAPQMQYNNQAAGPTTGNGQFAPQQPQVAASQYGAQAPQGQYANQAPQAQAPQQNFSGQQPQMQTPQTAPQAPQPQMQAPQPQGEDDLPF